MTDSSLQDVELQLLSLRDALLRRQKPLYAKSILEQQARTSKDFPASGPTWVSRETIPSPEGVALIDALFRAIRHLGQGGEQVANPGLADVKVQWVAHRAGVGKKEKEPECSEREKFRKLSDEVRSQTLILYLHGGALYSGGSAFTRPLISQLARLTEGRCVSVDYRLSPQAPFPAAILDALVAYLSLLYPQATSFSGPIPPDKVVFAGDSAGTQIMLALLQFIQYVQQEEHGKVNFWGRIVYLPMPAGFSALGAQADLPHCIPWTEENHKFDFLSPVSPPHGEDMAPCAVWPSEPPRGDVYCDSSALCHPLASPIAADSWELMPPMFFLYGEEYLHHEGRFIAARALSEGVVVEWHHYEKLMHIFPVVTPQMPQSQHAMKAWAGFCHRCVNDRASLSSNLMKYPLADKDVRGERLASLDPGFTLLQMKRMMASKASERKPWTGPTARAAL